MKFTTNDIAEQPTVAKQSKRWSNAATKLVYVTLDEIHMDPERFCHRDPRELKPKALLDLSQSIVSEGLQTPIEIVNLDGRKLVVKGHRRINVLRTLSDNGHPDFPKDMKIPAMEVTGATEGDLLLRSILDNEARQNLSQIERIAIAKKLDDASVSRERSADALGISSKTLERDLLIAQNEWMLQHVIDDNVPLTYASTLLSEAQRVGRIAELQQDLGSWVSAEKKKIIARDRTWREMTGKGISTAEKQVKSQINKPLMGHWVDCLRDDRRLEELAQTEFKAGIEPDSGQLLIESLRLNIQGADLTVLAKVASRLSQIVHQLLPVIQTRQSLEGPEGPQARIKSEPALYDLAILRENGLTDLAEEIESGQFLVA